MKLGFLSACLAQVSLDDLVPWAATQGFGALELAAWPPMPEGYQPRHIQAERFAEEDADHVTALFAEHGLTLSSLACYENNLHPDPETRAHFHQHLRHVIDAAALLDVDLVGTFVGGFPATPERNLQEAGEIFRGLMQYADDRGVRLMIENCPMENWVQFGLPGNYAFSPELWEALFNEVPSDNFGLNLDPSHLHWLGIDPLRAVRDFAGRIFHAHAKDTEILNDGTYRYSILSQQLGDNPWRSGWWRYRLPGKGEIDWQAFIAALQEADYDEVLSIEHEDPEYEGSEGEIKEGLRLGYEHLASFI